MVETQKESKPALPGYVKTALKIGLSILSFWLVFRKIEPERIWDILKRAHVAWLVLATGLYTVSRVIGAERLRLLFTQIGLTIGRVPNLKLYWLGMYYNLFLPGGIGGDGYKVYLLNRVTKTPVKPLVSATLLDRLIGLLPLLYLLALLAAVVPQVPVPAWLCWLSIPVGHAVALVLLKRLMPRFYPAFNRAVMQSLLIQIMQAAEILVLIRATGAAGEPEAYLLVFLISSIVSIIPFTIGGAGARELTFLVGAQTLGLPADAAVAVSLLFYVLTALISLTGVVYSFQSSTLTNDLSA